MGFSTAQGSTAHVQGVLKIENFVLCGHTQLSYSYNGSIKSPH